MKAEGKFTSNFEDIGRKYGTDGEAVQQAFYKYFDDYHFNKTLSQYNFWKSVLSELTSEVSEEEVNYVYDLFNHKMLTKLNEGMLDLIKTLSPHYKLVLLSNSFRDMDKLIFSSEFIKYFDRICLSHLNSYKKPNKKAFLPLFEDFDVDPNECLFIDDQLRHVEGAQKLGVKGIVYKNTENLIKELKKLKIKLLI